MEPVSKTMVRQILASVLLVITSVSPHHHHTLGHYISPCERHSPDFNACIRTALNSIIPNLTKHGIHELGVPKLDPLEVPQLSFSYNKMRDFPGRMVIANSTALGLADLTVLGVRSELVEGKRFLVEMDLAVPQMRMRGDFSATGRFGIFPVSGGGPYNITTGEVLGRWRLEGRPVEVDGVEYIHLDQFLLTPVISQFRVDAENVLRGNPQLSKMLVNFTNKFWQLVYEQSLPELERNLDVMGRDMLNRIFLNVPYDELFPLFQQPKPQAQKPQAQKPQAQKPLAQKPLAPPKPLAQKPTTRKPSSTTKRRTTAPTTLRTTTKRRPFGFLLG